MNSEEFTKKLVDTVFDARNETHAIAAVGSLVSQRDAKWRALLSADRIYESALDKPRRSSSYARNRMDNEIDQKKFARDALAQELGLI